MNGAAESLKEAIQDFRVDMYKLADALDMLDVMNPITKLHSRLDAFEKAEYGQKRYNAGFIGINVNGRMNFAIIPRDPEYAQVLQERFNARHQNCPNEICRVWL